MPDAHSLRFRIASWLQRQLVPVSPSGAPARPPKDPVVGWTMQVPAYQGFGRRDVLGWTVDGVKSAVSSMASGAFGGAGLLADDFRLHPIIADCLNVRWEGVNSLLPRKVSAACVVEHGEGCKRPRCRRERWVADWFREIEPEVYSDAILHNFHDDRLNMGFGVCGADWEERRDGRHRYWLPKLKPWHPSQTQYLYRGDGRSVDGGAFAATTMNKGLLVVEPGMGRWLLTAATERQPWIHGAVFSLGLDFVGDLFNFLTNQEFTERFGLGVMKYFAQEDYPRADASGGAGQVPTSAQMIMRMGSGAVVPLRKRGDAKLEDLELIHTSGSGWEAFDSTEKRILRRILLVYLGQDMTSVGQTGGFRQAVIHKETLWQKYGESASWFWDARRKVYRDERTGQPRVVWEPCDGVLRSQMTRWITWFNFRDFGLAPYCWRDATPPEDQVAREEMQAKHATQRASAIGTLADKLPQLQAAFPQVKPAVWFVKAGLLDAEEAAEPQFDSQGTIPANGTGDTAAPDEAADTSDHAGRGEDEQTATETTEFGAADDEQKDG